MSKLFLALVIWRAIVSMSMARFGDDATLASAAAATRLWAMAECCVANTVAQPANGALNGGTDGPFCA